MADFLVETALLTHGLVSLSNEDIQRVWPWQQAHLVWVEQGTVRRGTLEEYLPLRARAREMKRIDRAALAKARAQGWSGALTASGTMEVAGDMGVPLAVTAGMGGIGDIKGETLCADLPALAQTGVALVATCPKDVVDIAATVSWLLEHGVTVLGRETDTCSGFMFCGRRISLTGRWQEGQAVGPHTLLLQGIREEQRLEDASILPLAVQAGKEAEARGEYFHPAANAKIDALSGGRSSVLQLRSLIDNGLWAQNLQIKKENDE